MTKKTRLSRLLGIISLVALLTPLSIGVNANIFGVRQVEAAAVNLIVDGSFDKDIHQTWFLWKGENSTREYNLMRAYDTPFGYGPYSLSVKAVGTRAGAYDAGMVTTDVNRFTVTAGKTYNFSFHAKSSEATNIQLFLESTESYQAITEVREVNIGQSWTRQQIAFVPNASGQAALSVIIGNLPDEATLYLDGFSLFENTASVATAKVSGFIGDKNKAIALVNGNLFNLDELKIELPYVDSETGVVGAKQFAPKSITGNNIYFDLPAQTFSGIGKVYAAGSAIGQFDYHVLLRISDYGPNPASADEDLVIYGLGFSPDLEQNFVIVSAVDSLGKVSEKWLNPHIIDKSLTQAVVKLPAGVINSRLSVRNYHNNSAGQGVETKSNQLSYVLKPVIYDLAWSRPGYEQIGDKITITGKGIAGRPTVNFYDLNGNKISGGTAVIKEVNEVDGYEKIEISTPKQLNQLQATVKIGNYESDKADALSYSARPILRAIQARASRKLPVSNATVAAAKVGDTIKLLGQGYKSATSVIVEFPGLEDVVRVPVETNKIDPAGNWIEVVVPKEAQNGQVRVEINGQQSNQVSLEIIPHVISVTPLVPTPGEEMSFWTNGVGLDKEQVIVHFRLANNEIVAVKPSELTTSEHGDVIVTVVAPRAISNDSSSIKLQYGHWLNDQSYSLQSNPVIERASIDSDTKVLTIKGYGFSQTLLENQITYKYADGTVVNTKAKPLSIKNTSEGQEIRVQIIDDYYYGYISINVKGQASNEINIGPAVITRIERRVQFVAAENRVMGVLYISGRNFGPNGDVKVGDVWAGTHYRTNTFIIAVVEASEIHKNPVIVTKAQ